MTDKLDDAKLCELTRADTSLAIAECIDGLGCTVYEGGKELTASWVSHMVEGLVGVHVSNEAIVGTQTKARYFILTRNQQNDSFQLALGPFNPDDLAAEWTKANRAEGRKPAVSEQ